jgi:hypothetical protein
LRLALSCQRPNSDAVQTYRRAATIDPEGKQQPVI